MSKKRNNPETIAIHGGDYRSDPATNAVAVPIYRTTSYQFNSVDHAANLFALKEFGNIYTRIMNPTNDVLEKRIAALEGGLACLTVFSGQTASLFSILNVAQAGDNIISSTDLYGGTVSLFTHTLSKLGIEIRYADPKDPKNFEKKIDDKTRALVLSSIFFSKFLGSFGSAYLISIPSLLSVCVNKDTVPPYKSVELIILSPAWATFNIENNDAVCPEKTVKQAKPPSSAAILFSKTSFVGFIILV